VLRSCGATSLLFQGRSRERRLLTNSILAAQTKSRRDTVPPHAPGKEGEKDGQRMQLLRVLVHHHRLER
jgi:hypothetical protein